MTEIPEKENLEPNELNNLLDLFQSKYICFHVHVKTR